MILQAFPNDFAGAEVTRLILIPDSTNHLTRATGFVLNPAPLIRPLATFSRSRKRGIGSPNFVGGEGGTLAAFPKNLGLDWLCRHSQNSTVTVACPLLGERKQVRANVSTNTNFSF
ncbi:MAG: hypothetical protein WBS33_16965 [Verrucomicrobiia bacterium]